MMIPFPTAPREGNMLQRVTVWASVIDVKRVFWTLSPATYKKEIKKEKEESTENKKKKAQWVQSKAEFATFELFYFIFFFFGASGGDKSLSESQSKKPRFELIFLFFPSPPRFLFIFASDVRSLFAIRLICRQIQLDKSTSPLLDIIRSVIKKVAPQKESQKKKSVPWKKCLLIQLARVRIQSRRILYPSFVLFFFSRTLCRGDTQSEWVYVIFIILVVASLVLIKDGMMCPGSTLLWFVVRDLMASVFGNWFRAWEVFYVIKWRLFVHFSESSPFFRWSDLWNKH